MTAQLRAELLKHRSTFTNLGLFLAMLGLVLLAVLLHGLTLPADRLESTSDQVQVFRFGSLLGALFAALVGAMSITGEIRHGTIRPTFLITPRRGRVVAAKIVASGLLGIVFGLVAVGVAVGVGSAALAARGIPITLDGSDYALMPAGGIAAAALWAPIGLGLGALLRSQVATLLAIFLWLFFVENLLIDFVPGAGRFAPGAAAAAITGLDRDRLLAPALGALLLALYAATIAAAGTIATLRRDVP
ncbi:MAG TPA: ABC transporter permease subunit [Thermoanaerobaculia bacterium]|nr:ABC transporter permease subunit [Thermoanaerobaculia bacterium]